MAIYSLWNNKGGVGKSYLSFQIACEYVRTHPNVNVLVIDLCPQANSSGRLLGGMSNGEHILEGLSMQTPRKTISGYIDDRIRSPYVNPNTGSSYLTQVSQYNASVPQKYILSLVMNSSKSREHVFLEQPRLARLMRGDMFIHG